LVEEAAGSVRYDIEGDVVIATMRGHYTVAQVRDVLTAARHDPRIEGPRGLLVDARRAAVNPPLDEIRGSIDVVTGLREGFRFPIHIVVTSDLHYGLGRMVSALAGLVDMQVEISRDVDEARRAMGLPVH